MSTLTAHAANSWATRFIIALVLLAAAAVAMFGVQNASAQEPDVPEDLDQIELRHIDDDGDYITGQVIPNNVRGSRHVVCLADETNFPPTLGIVVLPDLVPSDIEFVDAGGEVPNDTVEPGATDVRVHQPGDSDYWDFVEQGGEADGATCFSWTSSTAGDQEVTVETTYDESEETFDLTIGWDNDTAGNGALVKEWNVLEDSTICVVPEDDMVSAVDSLEQRACLVEGTGSNDTPEDPTVEFDVPAFFNPADSSYVFDGFVITDFFNGSHATATEEVWRGPLAGVEIDPDTGITVSECGDLWVNFETDGDGTPVTNDEGYIRLDIDDGYDSDCLLNDSIVIEITGCEPGPLGSDQTPFCVTQVVVINLVTEQESKDVLLAWSGQRVIIEHDWRIPNGDVDGNSTEDPWDWDNDTDDEDPDALGECVFEDVFVVKYTAQAGSVGTFLSSLGGVTLNNNSAFVIAEDGEEQDDGEVPSSPQTNCISRALYTSNFEGKTVINAEVAFAFTERDLEAQDCDGIGFIQPECGFNQTDREVVIYFMKLEDVQVTLLSDLSKPTHNTVDSDWAPGNPWDVEGTLAETSNVSEDVLVRIEVRGWFTSDNASTREARNIGNEILPAGRWVMPDDWPILAADIDFAPQYDIMVTPDETHLMDLPEYVFDGIDEDSDGLDDEEVMLSEQLPLEGPYSIIDDPDLGVSSALSDYDPNNVKDTIWKDGVIDKYDAPMPPVELTVDIRDGDSGFLRQVLKQDVYYTGTANDTSSQHYPNPYYITDIPASPFIPAQTAGGGYLWDTFADDGPGGDGMGVYRFWEPIPFLIADVPGENATGVAEPLSADLLDELEIIRMAHNDDTIGRTLVVYTDNHGEAMVAANGDFMLTYDDCATNPIEGGHHCAQGDVVGNTSITAVAQYPDRKGDHPVIRSAEDAEITWTWGGYKEITIEEGETDQFVYVVFHALDRDGFCAPPATDGVSLHPVLTWWDQEQLFDLPQHSFDPDETVDFLIDAGEGVIVGQSGGGSLSGEQGVITGVHTFSTAENSEILEFDPLHGSEDECQAWIRISNSLLGVTDILAVAHDDEGDIGFDELIDLQTEWTYTLNFRWSNPTWIGADGISPMDALSGTGPNEGGDDIFDEVTAVYGWNQQAQTWSGFFPAGVGIPGVNTLTSLEQGQAYWIAIEAPGPVTWTVVTNVD